VRKLVAATGPGRAPEPCLLLGAPPEFLIVRHPLPLPDRAVVRRRQGEQLGRRQLQSQSVLPSLSSFPRCPHRNTGTAPRRPEAPNRGRNPLPGERP
jgi:hypothetical protein